MPRTQILAAMVTALLVVTVTQGASFQDTTVIVPPVTHSRGIEVFDVRDIAQAAPTRTAQRSQAARRTGVVVLVGILAVVAAGALGLWRHNIIESSRP